MYANVTIIQRIHIFCFTPIVFSFFYKIKFAATMSHGINRTTSNFRFQTIRNASSEIVVTENTYRINRTKESRKIKFWNLRGKKIRIVRDGESEERKYFCD